MALERLRMLQENFFKKVEKNFPSRPIDVFIYLFVYLFRQIQSTIISRFLKITLLILLYDRPMDLSVCRLLSVAQAYALCGFLLPKNRQTVQLACSNATWC